jgi:hypothetical protein
MIQTVPFTGASTLPEYTCHRTVRAAQVMSQKGFMLWLRVSEDPNAPQLSVHFAPDTFHDRRYPSPGWYVVVDDTGQFDFVTPEVFHRTYTPKPPPTPANDAT